MGKPTTIQYGSKALAAMPVLRSGEGEGLRGAYGFAPGDVVVGLGSSLGAYEAVPELLDALTDLPETVKLFFVGGLPERVAETKAMVTAKDLDGRTHFTGTLPTPEYLRHLAAIDIGCVLRKPLSKNIVEPIPPELFDSLGI